MYCTELVCVISHLLRSTNRTKRLLFNFKLCICDFDLNILKLTYFALHFRQKNILLNTAEFLISCLTFTTWVCHLVADNMCNADLEQVYWVGGIIALYSDVFFRIWIYVAHAKCEENICHFIYTFKGVTK